VSIKYGQSEVTNWLLRCNQIDKACFYNAPIRCAASQGLTDIVETLMSSGQVDPNVINSGSIDSPLRKAARNGHLEVVNILLSYHPTAYSRGHALVSAWEGRHGDIVDRLLADPWTEDFLQPAFSNGEMDIIDKLMHDIRYTDIPYRNNLVSSAALSRNNATLRLLLADSFEYAIDEVFQNAVHYSDTPERMLLIRYAEYKNRMYKPS
jgi:ankyrin repeat protein